MTEQDKELLLKDLCARLPYKTRCLIVFEGGYKEERQLSTSVLSLSQLETVCVVKPYLRPMRPSEATEQELKEIEVLDNDYKSVDWLNAHHFDYRGLIERGLALEAPEGMYN